LHFPDRLLNACESSLPPQHFKRLEQRWRVFPAADCDADRLKHLSCFHSQFLRGGAQGLIQRVVFELDIRQHFAGSREDPRCHCRVSLLRDEFRRIVGRELVYEEEIGGGEHVAQQLDALADQGRDPEHLFRRHLESGGERDGQQYFSMDLVAGKNLAEMIREKPKSAEQAALYVKTIAEAVHFAHERGILHRDLKPQNVLIELLDRDV